MKSSQKVKVILQNLKLIDVPTRQNRIFLKVKHGSFHYTTKPYQIEKSVVTFPEPVTIELTIPDNPKKAQAIKSARLSFRLENTSGSGFTRYGIVMLDIVQRLFTNDLNVRTGLENCSEKPVFLCTIIMPSNFNHHIQQTTPINEPELPSESAPIPFPKQSSLVQTRRPSIKGNHIRMKSATSKATYFEDLPSDRTAPISNVAPKVNFPQLRRKSQIHVSNSFNSLANRQPPLLPLSGENSFLSNQSSSTVQKSNLYENAPAKISPERFQALEDQIDSLLAGIIINNN